MAAIRAAMCLIMGPISYVDMTAGSQTPPESLAGHGP